MVPSGLDFRNWSIQQFITLTNSLPDFHLLPGISNKFDLQNFVFSYAGPGRGSWGPGKISSWGSFQVFFIHHVTLGPFSDMIFLFLSGRQPVRRAC